MLTIQEKKGLSKIVEGQIQGREPSLVHEWHIGEPIPEIKSNVVLFQADGDELEMILEAMKPLKKGE